MWQTPFGKVVLDFIVAIRHAHKDKLWAEALCKCAAGARLNATWSTQFIVAAAEPKSLAAVHKRVAALFAYNKALDWAVDLGAALAHREQGALNVAQAAAAATKVGEAALGQPPSSSIAQAASDAVAREWCVGDIVRLTSTHRTLGGFLPM